jgi:hypothetical protein
VGFIGFRRGWMGSRRPGFDWSPPEKRTPASFSIRPSAFFSCKNEVLYVAYQPNQKYHSFYLFCRHAPAIKKKIISSEPL